MVNLPVRSDPTLEAVDAAFGVKGNSETPRPYLGMSSIGKPCERANWYDFRWVSKSGFSAHTLYLFDDGHRSEDIMIERLRLLPEVTLHTIDPVTGGQIGFVDHNGHFRGHADGVIAGLLQAPKTTSIWEHKCCNEKKQAMLEKICLEDEKSAFKQWDETYYAQGQVYMHYAELTRHYLTVSSPGTRKTISCRTNYNKADAEKYIEKAKRVIYSDSPPPRINDNESFYLCKWCGHQDLCHRKQVAQVNCRTCLHSTPGGDGEWHCEHIDRFLNPFLQSMSGKKETLCPNHLFIPGLLPFAEVIDADQSANTVRYKNLLDSVEFTNGQSGISSHDIYCMGDLCTDETLADIRGMGGHLSK